MLVLLIYAVKLSVLEGDKIVDKIEQLKKEYSEALTKMIETYKQESERLMKDDCQDEAVMEKIKLNVADIFYKMFEVSLKKVCGKADAYEEIYKAYLAFFNKIPTPWREKLAKDKEYNMSEECLKEELKLETADKIQKMFEEYYARIKE